MKGKGCCGCSMIAKWLVVIGAVNWGLIGIGMILSANWNVVNLIFGGFAGRWVEAIIYILVGISGVVMLFGCKCKKCKVGKGDMRGEGEHMGNMQQQS